MATSPTIQCSLCNFQFHHAADHVKHVITFHQHQPQFLVQCSFENCGKTFNKWPSFKKHLQRIHHAEVATLSDEVGIASDLTTPREDELVTTDNEAGSSTWDAAEYVLSLREQGLTEDCISAVISSTETLLEKTVMKVKRSASDLLSDRRDVLDSSDWDEAFTASDVFSAVNTKWKQDVFFRRAFNIVVSELVVWYSHCTNMHICSLGMYRLKIKGKGASCIIKGYTSCAL